MGNRASRVKGRVAQVVGARKQVRAHIGHAEQMPFVMMGNAPQLAPLPPGCMKATNAEAEGARRDRDFEFLDAADPMLLVMLKVAVPLWIERHRAAPFETLKERGNACAEKISCGDAIERGAKRGATANLFNAIAEGLAVATLNSPDGSLQWCGLHFKKDADPEVARALLADVMAARGCEGKAP